jgi:hypothetical protein
LFNCSVLFITKKGSFFLSKKEGEFYVRSGKTAICIGVAIPAGEFTIGSIIHFFAWKGDNLLLCQTYPVLAIVNMN